MVGWRPCPVRRHHQKGKDGREGAVYEGFTIILYYFKSKRSATCKSPTIYIRYIGYKVIVQLCPSNAPPNGCSRSSAIAFKASFVHAPTAVSCALIGGCHEIIIVQGMGVVNPVQYKNTHHKWYNIMVSDHFW